MQGFSIFRLPYSEEFTLISGQVLTYQECASLSGQCGFVMAPFAVSDKQPILLIQADIVRRDALETLCAEVQQQMEEIPLPTLLEPRMNQKGNSAADYHIDFLNFHAHLMSGQFQKLVLSRSIDIERTDEDTPIGLFQKACERYPRLFIALAYTPQGGLWLTATPEILLAGSNGSWQTMALAGTMPYANDLRWNDKNIQEQRYVASYITQQLERFTDSFTEKGPYTARAGHLAHLRSDFHFTLFNNARACELIQSLHPTPAVCGLPKQGAFSFIQQFEHHQRSYYSGFMGPLYIDGQTNLYVTLRCMQIFKNAFKLYAGGGLLRDSLEEQEWQETEAKLDTMRRLIINPEDATAP